MTRVAFGGTFQWAVSSSVREHRGDTYDRDVRQAALDMEKAEWFEPSCVPDTETTLEYRTYARQAGAWIRDWMIITVKNAQGAIFKIPLFQNIPRHVTPDVRQEQESPLDFWIRGMDTAIALEKGLNGLYDDE